tara:strand:+ start:499 stop:684 length:186 start_codon:yes stop_codon:yes gene_type:complete
MRVADAIKYLLNDYKPEDEIVIAWWGQDMFENKEEFQRALDNEMSVDWANVHDQLTFKGEA